VEPSNAGAKLPESEEQQMSKLWWQCDAVVVFCDMFYKKIGFLWYRFKNLS
jgi:hypothetical protein